MTKKEGRPGQSGQNNQQLNDSTTSLDPEVCPDGKRKTGPDLTPEGLGKIVEKLPVKLDSLHFSILRNESSISPEVVTSRSPRSITADNLQVLQWLGLSQNYGPALLLPYFDREGNIVQVDIRFDRPVKTPDGKTMRYLSPAGLPKRLDLPRSPFPENGDIFLVEGIKKADSARSRGLYTIGLPGIWCLGVRAKEARVDLEALPLAGRTVIVILDTETKPKARNSVEKARTAICRYLAELGAEPKVVLLPEPADGTGKTGLDDFFSGGATVDALLSLVQEPDPPWRDSLVLSETGTIRPTAWNIRQILENDEEFEPIRKGRFNELSKRPELESGRPIDAPMITEIGSLIEGRFRTPSIPFETLQRVIELIAIQNPRHPIREWFESLPKWDGIPRIESLLVHYFAAKDTAFVRAVGRNLMIAAVARIFQPGCKHDHVVVFEGSQGIGKSTSISTLFGETWTTTSRSDISSKDFVSGILGFWAVELSELNALRRSQVEAIKAVVSALEDDIRLPYRRDTKRYPRQAVFIATTNEDSYLKDSTGNRRFWPIRCGGKIDLGGIRRDRDLLWTEALHRFRQGENWWTIPTEEARREQCERVASDAWSELIGPWLLDKWEVSANSLFEHLEVEPSRRGHSESTRLGIVMRTLGWAKKRVRRAHGLEWMFVPDLNAGTGSEQVGTSSNDGIVPSVPTQKPIACREETSNTCTPHNKNMYMGKDGRFRSEHLEHGATTVPFPCSGLAKDLEQTKVGTNPGDLPMEDI